MRYYNIQINNEDDSPFATFTSYVNGQTDLGALQVDIDFPVSPLSQPLQGGSLTIWGIGLNQLGGAANFNGKQIIVKAGMQKGLPSRIRYKLAQLCKGQFLSPMETG